MPLARILEDNNPQLTAFKDRLDSKLLDLKVQWEEEVEVELRSVRSTLLSSRAEAEQRARARTRGPIFPHRSNASCRAVPYAIRPELR